MRDSQLGVSVGGEGEAKEQQWGDHVYSAFDVAVVIGYQGVVFLLGHFLGFDVGGDRRLHG